MTIRAHHVFLIIGLFAAVIALGVAGTSVTAAGSSCGSVLSASDEASTDDFRDALETGEVLGSDRQDACKDALSSRSATATVLGLVAGVGLIGGAAMAAGARRRQPATQP